MEGKKMSEYDLKKSKDAVGPLRPVVKDVTGRIVDGLHRKDVDPDWPEEIWENINTEEEYWKVRAHLNYSRRNPHEARQEKLQIINSLAEYYVKQGLRVYKIPDDVSNGKHHGQGGHISPENEVLGAVIKALDGALESDYVRKNIDTKYTQDQKPREAEPIPEDVTPVERRIRGYYRKERQEQADKDLREYKKEIAKELRQEIEDEIAFKHDIPEILERPPSIIFSGQACQFIDPEALKPKGLGKDFSHLALFPNCDCSNCVHFNKCRGGELR